MAYTNNKYQEYINSVTKLLPHNKAKEKEDKEEKPVQFTYLEQEGLLVVGMTDGGVHVYKDGVLGDTFRSGSQYNQTHNMYIFPD